MDASNLRILVTGANGQLGHALCQQLGSQAVKLTRQEADFLDLDCLRNAAWQARPDALINTAAYTQVDRAEAEPELCEAVNVQAVAVLAEVCQHLDIPLVQISTDYVFGQASVGRPWREDDLPQPQGVYARSKWASEQIAATVPRHLIIRTCGLYSAQPHHRNFVNTMLRLAASGQPLRVVNDQHCTPSYVPHVAKAVLKLLLGLWEDRIPTGVYHVTNAGATNWFEFAQTLFRLVGTQPILTPILTSEYAATAPRPAYSVLEVSKFQCKTEGQVFDWKEGLDEWLNSWAVFSRCNSELFQHSRGL